MKKLLFLSIFLFLLAGPVFCQGIKEADLAGDWYPADPLQLNTMLNAFLKSANPKQIDGNIIAIISPHAGYAYSGSIAAYGFKLLEDRPIDTAIVIGFSHRQYFDGISVYKEGVFRTALGDIKVNSQITAEILSKNAKIVFKPELFYDENSLEMQLPFLQKVLKDFTVVPIIMGEQSYENCKILSDALTDVLKNKDKFVIIASTDLCHFLTYEQNKKVDLAAIELIKKMDAKNLLDENIIQGGRLMCGTGPVAATIMAAKALGADRTEILKYANSGDTTRELNRVVGYVSAVIYKEGKSAQKNIKDEEKDKMLTAQQEKRLLEIARKSIISYVKDGRTLKFTETDPALTKKRGAFVTIKERGQLRGCIGHIVPTLPLYETVAQMAVEAATGDPRFPPMEPNELDRITLEISVLSELEKINDPNKIEVGKHGILLRKGFNSGLLLPQVATEYNWNREEFLQNTCHKAGLPADAWKKGAEIYIFSAQVFGEEK